MPDLNLDEIKKRCEKATKEPWRDCKSIHGSKYRYVQIGKDEMYTTLEMKPDDARFIAHARTDIPALVAEVKRLQAIIKAEWNDMSTAPKTGPVREVALLTSGGIIPRAHWACGDGDGLMPAFGPAWFKPSGSGYIEVQGKILGWRELPENIKADALKEDTARSSQGNFV